MLEMISFNTGLYRYRMEDENTLLLFHLRSGEIYFIKGHSKDFVLSVAKNEKTEVNPDDKIVQFLKCIHAVVTVSQTESCSV